jgi:beta-N-acetylhexosaminidase
MLMVGFRGLFASDGDAILEQIRHHNIGGIVLYDYDVPSESPVRNIQSPEQPESLVLALQATSSTPLLVAVDQEGEQKVRLKQALGFPPTVSAQYLGTADDLALTARHAATMASTLSEAGINLNLAPVVELNVNPENPILGALERSFSPDPDVVTRHALEFIRSHHRHNVLCTLKHFPGHGSSHTDSHLGLVDISDTWSSRELEPYAKVIQAGEADAIMTAHVFNAVLDPKHPATLSKPTLTGVLREKLRYDGVVISDDMQMEAITDHYGFEVAIELAIDAGVDILLFGNNAVYDDDIADRAAAVIKDLVRRGKTGEERISASYGRIRRLKERLSVRQGVRA